MSDSPGPEAAEIARQVRQHVSSLRAAGVEWVPAQGEAPPAAEPSPAPEAPSLQASLFAAGVEATAPASVEDRRRELQVLAQRVAGCTRCAELAATRTQTVFGVGRLDPDVCFVGEAPGADEDRQGEPFVGQAGQLLNRIIAACGLKREEVYICNIIKCRPPGNRQPLPNEAGNCREYLDRQLDLVRPKFICALGATAAQNLLNTRAGIGKLRGRFYEYRGIPVICTFHPAALLPGRSPERKRDVWEDMKMLLARLGRPIPGK
jgi:DNA polymerase